MIEVCSRRIHNKFSETRAKRSAPGRASPLLHARTNAQGDRHLCASRSRFIPDWIASNLRMQPGRRSLHPRPSDRPRLVFPSTLELACVACGGRICLRFSVLSFRPVDRGTMKPLLLALGICLLATASSLAQGMTDAEVKQAIIRESLASYPGPCPCPYNTMRNGRACGKVSAYSKPGGYSPVCYVNDVTPEMIVTYRRTHGQ
jgi:hypothetical protein